MRVFMAGAITTIARVAMIVVVKVVSYSRCNLAEEIGHRRCHHKKVRRFCKGYVLDVPLIRFGEHVDADGFAVNYERSEAQQTHTQPES